uniref:Neur_chan_LBD domain-containing protein n=2 Tax=Caenorhabditis tropicalis TaxID=1561998 RepID=A0A1I7UWX0_9PELO
MLWMLVLPVLLGLAGSQMSVDLPPLRANEMVIPVSNRFLIQRASPITQRSISPFQVMQKLRDVPDDGETFREGPLDTFGRLTTRLVWKAFESDINQRIEGEWMWVPLKVLSGNGQIVSGMQYDMRVLAGTSNCSRYEINAYTIQDRNCVHFNGPKRAKKSWLKGRNALEVFNAPGSLIRKHNIETDANYQSLVYSFLLLHTTTSIGISKECCPADELVIVPDLII